MFRIFGLVVTLGVVCYLLLSFLSSDNQVKKAVNANPTVKEQQQTLKSVGVDGTDEKALMKYSVDQANQIQQYQNQAAPKE